MTSPRKEITPQELADHVDVLRAKGYYLVGGADGVPSNLAGFPTLPAPGTGVVVNDDDLLASLNRDGQTLDSAPPPRSTPMEIALAWCIGLTAGTILSLVAFCAVVGVLKLAGMV